jgi:hypothetical protein
MKTSRLLLNDNNHFIEESPLLTNHRRRGVDFSYRLQLASREKMWTSSPKKTLRRPKQTKWSQNVIIIYMHKLLRTLSDGKHEDAFTLILYRHQWRSVPFKIREDNFIFMSMALFILQHIGWLSFIFHSGQCNSDRFILLHDTRIFPIHMLYSFSPRCALLLSPCPFTCGPQCTSHQLYVTRRKNLSKPNRYTRLTSLSPY